MSKTRILSKGKQSNTYSNLVRIPADNRKLVYLIIRLFTVISNE